MTVALTYEALAERLGITIASARRLALRRRWSKSAGNGRRTVVQVPEEFLQGRSDSHTDDRSDRPNDSRTDAAEAVAPSAPPSVPETVVVTDLLSRFAVAQEELREITRKLGAAESEVAALRVQLDESRQRTDEWKMVADRFAAQTEQVLAAQAQRSWWPWKRLR